MGVIAFNGNGNIKQPSALKEELVHKVHNSTSIDGTVRRSWYADKYEVEMTFSGVSQAEYAVLAVYIFNQANPIIYSNAVTGINFKGFVTSSIDTFIPGGSWLKNITLKIQQL